MKGRWGGATKGLVEDHIIDEYFYREALAFSLNHDATNPLALAKRQQKDLDVR